MQTIERTTLSELVGNEQYARKVLPFIRGEYFSDRTERIVFEEIQKFVEKYNALPTKSTLEIEIDSRRDLNEDDIKRVLSVVKELENLMQYHLFSPTLWLWVLITLLVMIICWTQTSDLTTTIR